MKHIITRSLLIISFLLLSGEGLVVAQTFRYTTEAKTKMRGMGMLARVMGANKTQESTHYFTANAMRSDEGKDESSIFLLDEGKFIVLNHKKKNYYEMTFDQMASYMENARAEMDENMQEARDSDLKDSSLEFELSVDDLEGSKEIAGYQTDRKLIRMDFKYTAEVETEDGGTESFSGNMHAISDIWVAQDVEGEDVMKQFMQNYAEKFGSEIAGKTGMTSGTMQVFQMGKTGEAMEKMREEMQKIDGVALLTTTYIVMVPEGQELDVDAVLGGTEDEAGEEKQGGLGRFARNALKGGGIRLGKGRNEEQAQDAPQQYVMMETETVYTSIGETSDDASRFMAPGDYEMVDTSQYFGNGN